MNDDRQHNQEEPDGLITGVARRGVLGGLVAGVLAAAGLEQAEAKKKAKSNGKGRGKGKGKGKGHGKGKGKGKGQTKVSICHRKGKGKGFILNSVGQPAVAAHEAHGDVVCAVGACQTGDPIACDQTTGACIFDQAAEGTVCITEGGESGACDAAGICIVI